MSVAAAEHQFLWSFIDSKERVVSAIRRRLGSRSSSRLVEVSRQAALGLPASWITACQLSVWDNIAGPKVQQLWIGVDVPTDELCVTVARHSLAGDIAPPEPDVIESTLQVFAKFDAAALSTVFSAKHRRGLCKHSFSLLVHSRHLPRLMALQHVFVDRVRQLVRLLAALLDRAPTPASALAHFHGALDDALVHLERLVVDALPTPHINDTFLSPLAARTVDALFVARAVTSTLQTHGCAVVAGSADVARINMFISSLLVFLPPADLARSAFARPPSDVVERMARASADSAQAIPHPARSQYVPNLMVQGIVDTSPSDAGEGVGGSSTAGLSRSAVLASLLPTTLILVDARVVRQAPPYAVYLRTRAEFDNAAIDRAVSGALSDGAPVAGTTSGAGVGIGGADDVFRSVTEVAPCVQRLLEDTLSLPFDLRLAYISMSMRLLTRKAVLLVKFVEASTRDGSATTVPEHLVKRLRADLGARDAADFSVLLGIAERLRPGSYHALGGDPSYIEEQLLDMFESF
jgi:hypothetical protein